MGRSITEEYLNQNMLKENKSNEYAAYGSTIGRNSAIGTLALLCGTKMQQVKI